MTEFAATQAKNNFGEMLAACARAPVAIRRHGRVVAHLVGPDATSVDARPIEDKLAELLTAAGARYATLFGSLARGQARADSDADVAVWFAHPISSDLRMALTGLIAAAAGRAVDLIDLETAPPLIYARALTGRELVCKDPQTRIRLALRLAHGEDQRLLLARAARSARGALFK